MAIISFCTIHTFLLYKNVFRENCTVQCFSLLIQHLNGSSKHSQNSSWVSSDCQGGRLSGALHWQAAWYKLWVLWSSGYRKEPWGRYWYLLCTHTLLVKSNEKQQLQNSPWLPLESLCQKLLFHQSDHLLPQSNPVSLCEFSSSFWKASLSQHWVFLDWFKVLEGSTI